MELPSVLSWPPFPAVITNPKSHHLFPYFCGHLNSARSRSSFLRIRRPSISTPPTEPPRLRFCSRRAAGASPPPPPGEDPNYIAGIQASLSRIQDKLRIFFAVLFWMSLFFWGSVYDGRNDAKKKKGPWSRK